MEAILKVEGGKMLRARGEVRDGRVLGVVITGDFFLHPEEAIEGIEDALEGVELERDRLIAVIEDALRGSLLVGAGPEDIADLLLMLSG